MVDTGRLPNGAAQSYRNSSKAVQSRNTNIQIKHETGLGHGLPVMSLYNICELCSQTFDLTQGLGSSEGKAAHDAANACSAKGVK